MRRCPYLVCRFGIGKPGRITALRFNGSEHGNGGSPRQRASKCISFAVDWNGEAVSYSVDNPWNVCGHDCDFAGAFGNETVVAKAEVACEPPENWYDPVVGNNLDNARTSARRKEGEVHGAATWLDVKDVQHARGTPSQH